MKKVRERIGRYKYTPTEKINDEYNNISAQLKAEINKVMAGRES